jgi:hypothetical protein
MGCNRPRTLSRLLWRLRLIKIEWRISRTTRRLGLTREQTADLLRRVPLHH